MENMAHTHTSSEADTDQDSDGVRQSADRWHSDTESTATDSGVGGSSRGNESPTLEPASISSIPFYNDREETKDAHIALDLKEERSFSGTFQSPEEGTDGKQAAANWKDTNDNQLTAAPDVDLEKGLNSVKAKQGGVEAGQGDGDDEGEGECRVCHMVFESDSTAGEAMELGCDCKDDLSRAHRHCAETWFKIKGNRTCEICGSTAQNVVGIEDASFMEEWNDRDASTSASNEPTRCWQSQPLCNFLLACMVLAFVLPWLFRVTLF